MLNFNTPYSLSILAFPGIVGLLVILSSDASLAEKDNTVYRFQNPPPPFVDFPIVPASEAVGKIHDLDPQDRPGQDKTNKDGLP